ncbi:UPF0496 protein 1-like [Salvia hispanica]|uniref:UPF0496 protein 1-like n=1 Tax=Salvia hispanica TaxID=49212 RepID=UPI00200948B2|nr:UPF0496 protein 1-like [Salvia hispanica]
MSHDFDSAFGDLQKGIPNCEKMMIFAHSHYVNGLNTPRFCSSLQQSPHDSSIVDNFIYKSCSLYTEHLMMETRLKSMNGSLSEQLDAIGALKKWHSVLSNAAAMICVAVAAAVAANVVPVSAGARAVIGALAAAGSVLFAALGKWRQSVLKKRETAVKKHKEIAERMCAGARLGMKYLFDIHHVAVRLHLEIKSLSEATDELLKNDEAYSKSMESAKQEVLVSIRGV